MATPTNTPALSDISIKEAIGALKYNNIAFNTFTPYSKYFGDVTLSANATGKTIRVPISNLGEVQGGRGQNRSGFNPTPIETQEIEFSVDSWRGMQTEVSTLDLATDFDKNLDGIVFKPYATQLAVNCESDGFEETYNFGEAIVAPSTGVTFSNALDALSLIKENGGGETEITCVAGQRMHAGIVKAEGDKFNPSKVISDMNYKGLVHGMYAGMGWAVSENIPNWTSGTAADGAFDSATGLRPLGTVKTTAITGAKTLVIEGIGTDGTITKGSKIYIAGSNQVHPLTGKSFGRKKGYAVQATVTSVAGEVTVTLGEEFNDGSGTDAAYKNLTTLPTIGAIVYIAGEVSSEYKQMAIYSKASIGYAMVDLTKPDDGTQYVSDEISGVKIRILKGYGNGNDANFCTMDNYGGYKTLRPSLCVVGLEKIS